jgi:hypothetical protein
MLAKALSRGLLLPTFLNVLHFPSMMALCRMRIRYGTHPIGQSFHRVAASATRQAAAIALSG